MIQRKTSALRVACGLLTALALLPPVWSQTPADAPRRDTSADNELLLSDEPIVVTATRTAQRLSDSPAAVTVITEEQIRDSGATSLPDLLRSVPGVDVVEPNRSQANVAIRGFNQLFANKLLVMIDGRSIYQDAYGIVYWNTEPLLLSRIQRIEIVRGPGSVLYGANAFSGVINIITKTPQEMAAGHGAGTLVAAHGEQNSNFSEATYSLGRAGSWAATAGAGYHSTDGFGGQGPSQVHDASRVPILSLDLQKQTARGSLALSASDSQARADLTSGLVLQNAEWNTSSVSLAYNEDRTANPVTARAFGNFLRQSGSGITVSSDTYDLEAQQQRALSAKNTLVYGLDRRSVGLSSSLIGASRTEQLWALYLQDQAQIAPQTNLFAGVRWDKNSVYGAQVSPRVSLVHHLRDGQTARLSYGTAFRAPTLLETYLNDALPLAPGLDEQLQGNQDLTPEKIVSTEAGYRKDLRGGYVAANVFYNSVSRLIQFSVLQFAPSPPLPPGIPLEVGYRNQSDARAAGFELEGDFSLARRLRCQINYAYQNVTNATLHQQIDLSPHNKVNLVLQDDLGGRWTAYAAAHYVDASTYFNGFALVPISAYTRVDARLGCRLGDRQSPWRLSVAATNLLGGGHFEYPASVMTYTGVPEAIPQERTAWIMADGKF